MLRENIRVGVGGRGAVRNEGRQAERGGEQEQGSETVRKKRESGGREGVVVNVT